MPRVSVLIPAFNAERTLGAALRSVGRQTEAAWECVIVDDGSSDQTLSIAEKFSAQDSRFRVLGRQHTGIVGALNAGLVACHGEFIARMDADDLMARCRLERQLAALEANPDWAGAGCHVRFFPRRGMSEGLLSYERWLASIQSPSDVLREAFVECPLAHPSLMLRREALLLTGYQECLWPEDYDLLLRLLQAGQQLGVVPERLLHWRDGSGRLSRSSARYSIPAFTACKAEYLARGFLCDTPGYLLWGYGHTGKALAAALAQRGKHPTAIIELHPGRLGQLIRGVPVVPPAQLATLTRAPLIVSVAGLTPRTEIRAALAALGFVERRDFLCGA